MATLNFKGAYQFSITGGIYSEARHVTMISSSADPRGTISRDYHRRARRRPRSSRSQAGARPPSPSSSESSSISSDNSYQSRQSTPPTSADEHENSSSQAVPLVSHGRPDMLSPLSSRLGAMPGFTTPADLQTPVAPRPADLARSPDVAIIMSRPNEAPTHAQSHAPALLNHHPGRDVGVRARPQGPRSRPLPHPPPSSQFVHRGTPADLLSLTGSHSHTTESSSWDSFVQEPPHAFMRASTTPSTSSTLPLQPFHFSPRSRQADMFAHVNYPSRSSPSQAFLTSPFQQPFAESMTSPSRRSVQSPPPNRPLRSVPLPPRSVPPRTHTASRSHATIRSTYSTRSPPQAFWPSSTEQSYHSYVGPMNYPEMDVQSPTLYQYPSQDQNSPNQDYFYIPSSGIPHQYMPRSPYVAGGFAYDPPSPYPQPLQSERRFHEHARGSNNGPFLSSPRY